MVMQMTLRRSYGYGGFWTGASVSTNPLTSTPIPSRQRHLPPVTSLETHFLTSPVEQTNKSVTSVDLSYNTIGPEGAASLGDALKVRQFLFLF